MFKKSKKDSASSRLDEEKLYEKIANEILSGVRRDGLWAKALADSDGDQEKAKSLYIKLRVQSIKDEDTLNSDKSPKKLPTKDPNYILCSHCGFNQWKGYSECQKCGKKFV